MSVAKRKKVENLTCGQGFNKDDDSSAQITTSGGAVEVGNDARMKSIEATIMDGGLAVEMRALIEVLAINGCRVSEALNIKHHNIISETTMSVKGLKGSSDRIVFIAENSRYIKYCLSNSINPFLHISRYQVYRELKKRGLQAVFGDNKHFSTTHIFRHLFVKKLREKGMSDSDIAKIIGHKNVNNTQNYGIKEH